MLLEKYRVKTDAYQITSFLHSMPACMWTDRSIDIKAVAGEGRVYGFDVKNLAVSTTLVH